jgi:hypothetical protein
MHQVEVKYVLPDAQFHALFSLGRHQHPNRTSLRHETNKNNNNNILLTSIKKKQQPPQQHNRSSPPSLLLQVRHPRQRRKKPTLCLKPTVQVQVVRGKKEEEKKIARP